MTITVEQNELIAAKIHLPADFKMSIDIIMEMLAESKLSNADAIISNYDKQPAASTANTSRWKTSTTCWAWKWPGCACL